MRAGYRHKQFLSTIKNFYMGRLKQGILGGFFGKVDTVIGGTTSTAEKSCFRFSFVL
jgi:hypothetical protein